MMVPIMSLTIGTLTMSPATTLHTTAMMIHQHTEMMIMIQKNQATKRGNGLNEPIIMTKVASQNGNTKNHLSKNQKKNKNINLKNKTAKIEKNKKQLRLLKKKNMKMKKKRNLMKNQSQGVNITERKKMTRNQRRRIK